MTIQKRLKAFLYLRASLLALLVGLPAVANEDPVVLQERAIARIEAYADNFRRTFDRSAFRDELERAEQELEESVAQFRARQQLGPAAQSLVKLGDLYRYRDQWDTSIVVYEEAVRTAQEATAPRQVCKALLGHARSLVYGKRAPGPAAELVERAIRLAKGIDDPSYLFDALDLKAQIQVTQGDLIGAADALNLAFSVAGSIEDDKLLFYGYLDRGDMYQKLAERCDFERAFQPCLEAVGHARKDYEQALDLARQLGWNGLAEQTNGFLKRLKLREELIRSQQRFHRSLTESGIFAPVTARDVLVTERFVTGENQQLSGLLAWIEREGGIPPATDPRGAYVQGLLLEMGGQSDEALEWYLRAVELLERDRGFLHSEQARGSFLEDKVEFYYTTMLHLLERGRLPEAFALMEKSRARVMADLLATRDLALSDPEQRELYASVIELRAQIGQQQERLFDLRNAMRRTSVGNQRADAARDADSGQRGRVLTLPQGGTAKLEAELTRLEGVHEDVTRRIREKSPRLARLVTSEPVSLDALQRILAADGSDLLAYTTLESQLVIWHVGPRSVHVRSVFLPRSELKRKVTSLREGLVDPKRPFDYRLAHELYLFLVEPALGWVETDQLVIVPHEDLNYLPFQVLLASAKPQQFLGDRYRVTYAPSATVLTSLPPPQPITAERLLAIADPSLAHAPAEVRSIGERYPGRVEANVLPNEADVKNWMRGRDLVHLAVHGRFVADQPLLSHLSLRGGNGEDGRLTAAEMYGLPLGAAKLVVLSACETGSVKATHANEVLGMTRGLLFAGADSLLLSAWPIDDAATAAWMQAFYEAAGTKPPAEAARLAIKTLRMNPNYGKHPFFWGPFLLIGR